MPAHKKKIVMKEHIVVLASTQLRTEIEQEYPAGQVEQESDWNPWAIRYEPAFFSQYIATMWVNRKLTDITEAYGRAFSWGLCQTMGEVAREIGYTGPFAQLCEPETGLDVGARVFFRKLTRADGNVRNALLAWNGGDAKDYPDQVLAKAEQFKT